MPKFESGDGLVLEDLRVFLAVARSGSLRATAQQLFLSQPTLSRSLARLEEALDVPLFVRGPRGVILTTAGESLIPRARTVLDAAAELQRSLSDERQFKLSIGATATSARTILAPYLAKWIPLNPNVQLKAIEDSDTMLLERIENGECDVAVVSSDRPLKIESLLLGPVQIRAYFPREHRLANSSEPVTVAELSKEQLLINGSGFPSTIRLLDAMERGGLTPQVVYQCSTGQTLAAMAQAGLGVAVFGSTTVLDGFELVSRPVVDSAGDPLRFDLYVVWKKTSTSALLTDFAAGLATSTLPMLRSLYGE